MIRSLNPNSTNTSKTAEIMSRFRPIAPKPEFPVNSLLESPSVSQRFRQSPYLSNIWANLQARPTRTRKRGRTSLPPHIIKRSRTHLLSFSPRPPSNINNINTPSLNNISLLGSIHGLSGLPKLPFPVQPAFTPINTEISAQAQGQTQPQSNLVILPPLSCHEEGEIPQERDFLQQIEGPINSNLIEVKKKNSNLITPQPVRPVGSSISVGFISKDPSLSPNPAIRVPKKRVEEEVESEELPAVVSDSNNIVRMANSAYKEMVGQPECSWLEFDGSGGACKRINGEVMLRFSGSDVPVSANGFSCWVKIEWGSNEKKSSVSAFSDVMRLSCESKDYLFAWRFHPREASESCSY